METEDIRQKFDAYDQRLLEHDRQLGDIMKNSTEYQHQTER